jgi:hypothetical protein
LFNISPALLRIQGVSAKLRNQTLNKMMDDRKHLTSLEVGKLIEATSTSRNAARDRCLLLSAGYACHPRCPYFR